MKPILPPPTSDLDSRIAALSRSSSLVEKIVEHAFIAQLGQCLWSRGITAFEILRSEVDNGGYDLIVACNGITRYIQFKGSHERARTASVKVSTDLAKRDKGCVIWLFYELETLKIRSYRFLNLANGDTESALGTRIAKHTKANAKGVKLERPRQRVVNKGKFQEFQSIEQLVDALL